ncbi:MAG: hypothetical protein LBH65_03405, partial [Desulfovibrio sp.]|jgi:hypothetical protein|nr:hypothetical protein [Desulfovibrio sp.]
VRLGDLRIIVRGKGKERMVMADMHQKYADKAGGGDEGLKTLTFIEKDGRWLITQEDWSPIANETGY